MYTGYLALAADHAGYKLKKRLARFLQNELKLKFEDFGPTEFVNEDDYPDYVIPAAKKTVKNNGRAILICGSGNGACLAANKVSGMRAILGYNIVAAELGVQHNNSNGLCLAGRVLTEDHAMAIVKKWLETTEFLGGKYEKRNEKIEKICS